MALELAPAVRVNCLCPGIIDTDMARVGFAAEGQATTDLVDEADGYPLKRIGTATEVATAILYLASPDAGFITGAALAIDGGGIAPLPSYMCQELERSGELIRVLPEWSLPPVPFHAVFPSHRGATPKVRAFLDFLAERLTGTLAAVPA